jgi:hypothetical protein
VAPIPGEDDGEDSLMPPRDPGGFAPGMSKPIAPVKPAAPAKPEPPANDGAEPQLR